MKNKENKYLLKKGEGCYYFCGYGKREYLKSKYLILWTIYDCLQNTFETDYFHFKIQI